MAKSETRRPQETLSIYSLFLDGVSDGMADMSGCEPESSGFESQVTLECNIMRSDS